MTTVTLPDNVPPTTTALWPDEDDGDEGRLQRGLAIAATTPFIKVPGGWITPSQADPNVLYRLARDEDGSYCECPDYTQRQVACKHALGLEYVLERDRLAEAVKARIDGGHSAIKGHAAAVLTAPDSSPAPQLYTHAPEKLLVPRLADTNPPRPPVTAPHSTKSNQAQENETVHFIRLLWDLVSTVSPLERERGRKPVDIRKVVYGLVYRIHTTKSGRRAYSDLKLASQILGLGKLPSRPTLTRYMESPKLTSILEDLVETSAVPLSPLETSFSVDSSGFGTTIRDEQWADAKWGSEESRKSYTGSTWTKAHFMVGNYTNVITAAFVTPSVAESGDAPQLRKLLATTRKHFNVESVHADKAYTAATNLQAIVKEGAKAYIPFKKDSVYRNPTAKNGKLWNALLFHFRHHTDEFYKVYHQRSNVESDFSAVKRIFDNLTRSISPHARVNEVLMKAVAYNITRIIHATYTDGIEPFFGE